ncbi:MAG: ABC transporter permease [Anaerolineaceae bacterium]|nr:ABC transporter permease [Anaerolineaceae bacterium]
MDEIVDKSAQQPEFVSPWQYRWKLVRRNKGAMLGLTILILFGLIALAAPWIAPYDPFKMDLLSTLSPPTGEHWLGTDELGRDVLSRLIHGTRISLSIGFIVESIAVVVGVLIGSISGYFGGKIDAVFMRLVDIVSAFPFLILAIAVVAVLGPSLLNMLLVLTGVLWVGYARLIRGLVLSIKKQEYVEAARALGGSHAQIIFRHIIPSCLGVIIVQATFGIASTILTASGLSFLGMGAQPPSAEWGAMLSTAKPYLRQLPILSIAPGMAIMTTVLAINFVGDALRDAFDPHVLKVKLD